MAGFRVPYAIEQNPGGGEGVKAKERRLDRRDVREVRGAEVLDRLDLYRGELSLGDPAAQLYE